MENLTSNSDIAHVRATAEAAKTTADCAHRDMRALEATVGRQGRREVWSTIAVVLMAIALTGACGSWLNTKLNSQGASFASLLGMHQGTQRTVDSLSRRMIGAETALSVFPAELKKVTGRVDALDQKVTAVRQAAAKQPAAAPVNSVASTELEKQISLLHERIMILESMHNADIARIESIRGELAALSQDISQQVASVKSEFPPYNSTDVARLWAAVDGNSADISSIASGLERDRRDFEIYEDRASEVAPGVHLTVRSTNVGRQEISGWVYMENDHRVVFLKNHGLLEPITVYGVSGKRAHEIVITRVRENDAIGYVLSPKSPGTAIAGGSAPEVAGFAR